MNTGAFLSGMAVGAAVAFTLDPDRGRRRQALIRDKIVRGTRLAREGADATLRDMSNRARGVAAATRGRFSRDTADDTRLRERVRTRLGRVCSHAHAIDVEVSNGEVALRGPIIAAEVDDVLAAAAGVRGVSAVLNELDPHESADGIPALQGRGTVAGPTIDVFQRHWAPATRALVGMAAFAAGSAALAYARR
jgi:hypothetical protein